MFKFMGEFYGAFNGIKFVGKCGYVDVVRVYKKGVIDISVVGGIGWNDAFEGSSF